MVKTLIALVAAGSFLNAAAVFEVLGVALRRRRKTGVGLLLIFALGFAVGFFRLAGGR